MKTYLLTLLVLSAGSLYAQTPAPAKSPLDPVITKFNSAAAKVNAGDFNTAIAEFEEVLTMADAIGPTANDLKSKAQAQLPILQYQMGSNMAKQKKYEEAIQYLEKSIELADTYSNNPAIKEKALKTLPNLLLATGNQKYKEQKYDEALKYLQDALKYSPDNVRAYLAIGHVYADKNDEEKMITNLQKAIELATAASDVKTAEIAQKKLSSYYINIGNNDLAEVEAENPDFSFAIKDYEKAISYDPKATDAYYTLAVIYNKKMEFDKAVQNGLKALENETVDVKIAAINYELGVAYINTAEYPKACDALNKAMVGPIAEKAQARKAKVPNCN